MVDSTIRIPRLMDACAENGMPAVALTDQNNLFGLVKFYRKAMAAGIKPVIGLDLRILNEDEPDRPYTMSLLVQNNDGYRNLSELVTRSYIEGQVRGEPMARREWLTAESCEGLIALSGGLHGDIGHALHANHGEQARELLEGWRAVFPDRFYLELIRTGRSGEEECVRASLELASATGTPVVATNDVRFLSAPDFDAHEARVCWQTRWKSRVAVT
jgi:DNA polymerase-3 subunit alpha